ncbi:2-oxoacid:acceptor oxidoreductase family protein [Candidatus Micrarchaeota archaeon]|nr:2-oxoacid:acceptor oxidoreductase family protein [Candidatus Micrarchaeota archaeon]
MTFNVMLTGVGGEGVLTAAAIVASAAQNEGLSVHGLHLHGLAQRGGTIPTFVRFGKGAYSPGIMQADADLVLAFEPLEAARATFYANKKKTLFIINDWPHMPVYANLLDMPYPNMTDIVKRIKPFAKNVMVFNTHKVALEKFGVAILGNTMLIGVAVGSRALPLKETSVRNAITANVRRNTDKNLEAFKIGLNMGKNMEIFSK